MMEHPFVAHKIAGLIVHVAKREWPQNWDFLLNDLYRISKIHTSKLTFVLYTMKALADEIMVFSTDLPNARKSKLNTEFKLQMKKILHFFNESLLGCYSQYKQAVDPQQGTLYSGLVFSIIDTLKSYVEWIPVKLFVEEKEKVWPLLLELLQVVQFRRESASCLEIIFQRKERHELLFGLDFLDPIATALRISHNDEQDYFFMNQIFRILLSIGKQIFSSQIDPNTILPKLEKFIDILLQIALQASHTMFIDSVHFWKTFFDHKKLFPEAVYVEIAARLLSSFGILCYKLDSSPENSFKFYSNLGMSKLAHYILFQIQEDDDFLNKVKTSLRGNAAELYKILVPYQPLFAVTHVAETTLKTIQLLESHQNEVEDWPFVLFEGTLWQIDHIINNIPDEISVKVLPQINTIFDLIFNFQPKSSLLTSLKIVHLPNYTKLLKHNNGLLKKLVFYLLFPEPKILQLREYYMAILRIAAHIPQSFAVFFGEFLDMSQKVLSNHTIHIKDRDCLFEGLITISNEFKSFPKQREVVNIVLKHLETQFLGLSYGNVLNHPTQFLQWLGVGQENLPASLERISELLSVLHCYQVVWKRCAIPASQQELLSGGYISQDPKLAQHPLSQMDRNIMPTLFLFARMVNWLMSKEIRDQIKSDWNIMYEPDVSFLNNRVNAITNEVSCRRSFLWNLAKKVYSILGSCCAHQEAFYFLNNISELLKNYLFLELSNLDNLTLHIFLKDLFFPMVRHCPQHLYGVMFPAFVSQFQAIFQNIERRWVAQLKEGGGPSSMDSRNNLYEMVQDNYLREALIEYLNIMEVLFLEKKYPEATTFILFLKQNQASLMEPLLNCLCRAAQIPDISCSRKATLLLESLTVSIKNQSTDITDFLVKLTNETVSAAFAHLKTDPQKPDVALTTIIELASMYPNAAQNPVWDILKKLKGDPALFENILSTLKTTRSVIPLRKYLLSAGLKLGSELEKKDSNIIQLPDDQKPIRKSPKTAGPEEKMEVNKVKKAKKEKKAKKGN
uniref:Exportin-1/Importin-beta-like domain-containing protein n=1 Tax=Arcella intermedia TaxID=1963864 RepID=A0A6B2KX55_9EUKA